MAEKTKKSTRKAVSAEPSKKTKKVADKGLSSDFLKAQAYRGTREVDRVINKFCTVSDEHAPLEFLKDIANQYNTGTSRFTTAQNDGGVILRIFSDAHPKAQIRLVTHKAYKGKVGIGSPMMKGSKTQTNGIALENMGKLDGLEPQKNKPGKYWWFNPSAKNAKLIHKMIKAVGY